MLLLVYTLVLLVALTSILVGRFYCGWLCPFGALTEMLYRALPWFRVTMPPRVDQALRLLKYLVLTFILLAAVYGVPIETRRLRSGNSERRGCDATLRADGLSGAGLSCAPPPHPESRGHCTTSLFQSIFILSTMNDLEQQFEAIDNPSAREQFLYHDLLGEKGDHQLELHYRLIQRAEGETQRLLWHAFAARGLPARNHCLKHALSREDTALFGLLIAALTPQSETQTLEMARRAALSPFSAARELAGDLIDDLVDGGHLRTTTRNRLFERFFGRTLPNEACWTVISDRPRMAALDHHYEHQRYLFVVGERRLQTISAGGFLTMEATGTYIPPLRQASDAIVALVPTGHRPWIVMSDEITSWSGEPASLGMMQQTISSLVAGHHGGTYRACAMSMPLHGALAPSSTVAILVDSGESGAQLFLLCEDTRCTPSIPLSVASLCCHHALPGSARTIGFPSPDTIDVGTDDGLLMRYHLERDHEEVARLYRAGDTSTPPPPITLKQISRPLEVGFPVVQLSHHQGHCLLRGPETLLWTRSQTDKSFRLEDETLCQATLFSRQDRVHLATANDTGITIHDPLGTSRTLEREGVAVIATADNADYVVALTNDGLALRFSDAALA